MILCEAMCYRRPGVFCHRTFTRQTGWPDKSINTMQKWRQARADAIAGWESALNAVRPEFQNPRTVISVEIWSPMLKDDGTSIWSGEIVSSAGNTLVSVYSATLLDHSICTSTFRLPSSSSSTKSSFPDTLFSSGFFFLDFGTSSSYIRYWPAEYVPLLGAASSVVSSAGGPHYIQQHLWPIV